MLVNDKNLKNRRKKIMKRLAIKKLIVISQSESRSLEVPFENGLNIILGGNKTGKSSIIKSIFTLRIMRIPILALSKRKLFTNIVTV